MKSTEQFESALRSPQPAESLRVAANQLAAEGQSNTDIYASLEQFLLDLRKRPDHRESDEDLILDMMDALGDWCHPSAKLLARDDSK